MYLVICMYFYIHLIYSFSLKNLWTKHGAANSHKSVNQLGCRGLFSGFRYNLQPLKEQEKLNPYFVNCVVSSLTSGRSRTITSNFSVTFHVVCRQLLSPNSRKQILRLLKFWRWQIIAPIRWTQWSRYYSRTSIRH